jgi:hypothetical protein
VGLYNAFAGLHPATEIVEKKRFIAMARLQGEERQQVDDKMRAIPRNEIDYLRLKRRHTVKEEIYTMFSKRLQEVNIAETGILDDMTIVALAKLPQRPVSDDLFRELGIGLFIGLIVGILIVILRELFDTSIGTIEDVEQSMKLPVIAVIDVRKRFRLPAREIALSDRLIVAKTAARSVALVADAVINIISALQ